MEGTSNAEISPCGLGFRVSGLGLRVYRVLQAMKLGKKRIIAAWPLALSFRNYDKSGRGLIRDPVCFWCREVPSLFWG